MPDLTAAPSVEAIQATGTEEAAVAVAEDDDDNPGRPQHFGA